MATQQYYGLAKRPYYGLNYDDMIRSLARNLPQFYAQKESRESQEATKDYYNKQMVLADEANDAAKTSSLTSNLLGVAQTGLSAYNLLKPSPGVKSEPGMFSGITDKISSGVKSVGDTIGSGVNTVKEFMFGAPDTYATSQAGKGVSSFLSGPEPVYTGPSTPGPIFEGTSPLNVDPDLVSTPVLDILGPEAEVAALPLAEGEVAADVGGDLAGLSGIGDTAGSGATAAGTSVAGVAAYIALAELMRGWFGGPEKTYDEKTNVEKAADSPGTIASTPWAIGAHSGTVADRSQKGMSAFERGAMAPIDFIFSGDFSSRGLAKMEKQSREAAHTIEDISRRPFGDEDSNKWAQTANFIVNPVQGVVDMFCFMAGTQVEMADGTKKDVKDIEIFDEVLNGGVVTGIGKHLADDIYDYCGVQVTGSHAVFEDGQWIRVRDSKKATSVQIEDFVLVYIINNMKHQLVINDIVFADFGEVTNSEHMTANDRLVYLNDYCKI